MAIVTVNCDLLRRRLDRDDPATAFVEDIAAAGARAAALTQQLLAFSRAQPTVRAVLDLNRIVGEMGRMLVRVIGEDVVLVTRLADGIGAVEADRGQLEQVLMNLVVNARDAMPRGGTLTIETSEVEIGVEIGVERAAELGKAPPGRYVALTVRDTGTGMDAGTLAHIFDPFFTTKETGQGTGLGLATVYGIVQQNGGVIAVDSAPAAGTRFTIYLPRAAQPEAEAPAPSDAHTPRRGTEIILLVEDQERLRDAIGVVLRGYGYEVIEARDGDDAVALAEGFPGPNPPPAHRRGDAEDERARPGGADRDDPAGHQGGVHVGVRGRRDGPARQPGRRRAPEQAVRAGGIWRGWWAWRSGGPPPLRPRSSQVRQGGGVAGGARKSAISSERLDTRSFRYTFTTSWWRDAGVMPMSAAICFSDAPPSKCRSVSRSRGESGASTPRHSVASRATRAIRASARTRVAPSRSVNCL